MPLLRLGRGGGVTMPRLRDWPPRRIGLLWIWGCGLEGLLLAALWVTGDRPPPRPDALADSLFASDTAAVEVDPETLLRDAGFILTREPLPSGGTRMHIARDSSFVDAQVRGDTITILDASPDVRQAGATLTAAFVAGARGLARLLLFLAAILLPIPILLVSVTLTWAVQRRLRRT